MSLEASPRSVLVSTAVDGLVVVKYDGKVDDPGRTLGVPMLGNCVAASIGVRKNSDLMRLNIAGRPMGTSRL